MRAGRLKAAGTLIAVLFFFIAVQFFAVFAASAAFAACTVATTDPNFGAYDPFLSTPATTKSGTITVSCDARTQDIVIKIGPTPNVGFDPRKMKNAEGDTLNYNLYTDGTYTVILGDGTGGTETITFPNIQEGHSRKKTVFGMIPARQDVGSGEYSDSLTVTVEY